MVLPDNINMEKTTIDHDEIRQWAEKHQGKPQIIDHPEAQHDKLGIRIDFPGVKDDVFLSTANPPREIGWDEWFQIFDDQELAFQYLEETEDQLQEAPSLSYEFIQRAQM